MKILIDLQGAQNGSRGRGIGRYSLDLTRGIVRNAGSNHIVILVSKLFPENVEDVRQAVLGSGGHATFIEMEAPAPVGEIQPDALTHVRTAELVREDLLHSLEIDVVLICSLMEGADDNTVASIGYLPAYVPTAVVVYDFIPLFDEDLYLGWKPIKDWYYRKLESMRRADLLLAISDSAAGEAISHLGADPKMVKTIGSAADERFVPGELGPAQKAVLTGLGVVGKFLMHASAFDRRKNFEGLVEAFSVLPGHLRDELQLVLVTQPTPDALADFRLVVAKFGVPFEKVIVTGHISDDALVVLYQNASLFVFPSFHEGFGLPMLEAMRCGCAVIGSNLSSIPEVIGREDSLFDPTEPQNIADAISRALTEPGRIEVLKAHSTDQAKKFSWDHSAQKALDSLKELASRPLTNLRNDYNLNRWQTLPAAISVLLKGKQVDRSLLSSVATSLVSNGRASIQFNATAKFTGALKWRIEGPFDSSYSLALLNRETARALDLLGHDVVLHSTEGPGDFEPNPAFLRVNPDLAEMHKKSGGYSHSTVDVLSRNLYPPRVADMASKCNFLHHYAWEESGFPGAWVEEFNSSLDGITCLSTHVEKILLDNGVTVPLTVSGAGVDHWDRVISEPQFHAPGKKFKFLHVSSCFPRKGVDALLRCYGRAFGKDDDVSLVIKTFPNPHNLVHQWLAAERESNPDYPDVVVVEGDLTDQQLKALYEGCDVLVGPSRAEGFGLPFGEAMLSGLPVITTNWGGQTDFCTSASCWLVDYDFVPAESHFRLPNSVWAEPSEPSLMRALLQAHQTSPVERREMAGRGAKLLRARFSWVDAAARAVVAARATLADRQKVRSAKFGWITTWNTKCGIATYSECLLDRFPSDVKIFAPITNEYVVKDGVNVHRCWNQGKHDNQFDSLSVSVLTSGVNIVVVQFNYGFFNFEEFGRFLTQLVDRGVIVVLVLHSTTDPPLGSLWNLDGLLPALKRCHRLLVHSRHDLNRLKARGLIENVAIYPHGILLADNDTKFGASPTESSTADRRLRISAFGFCLPSKGFLELVRACSILKNRGLSVKLRLVTAEYPDPTSREYIEALNAEIGRLRLSDDVELITEFLPVERSLELISEYDIVVFPYRQTGESASGAVRHGIASGRPVMVTPIPIFDDLGTAVFRSSGSSEEEMALSLWDFAQKMFVRSADLIELESEAERWRRAHDYGHTSSLLHRICLALFRRQPEVAFRWSGSSREFSSAVGVVRGSCIAPTQKEGHLLYGPYVRLAAGSYRCVVKLSRPVEFPAEMGIEVACSGGSTILASWRAGPEYLSADAEIVKLPFLNAKMIEDLEVRIWVNKMCKSSIECVVVESQILH